MLDPHIELVNRAEGRPGVPWLPPLALELEGRLDSEPSCARSS